MKVIIATFMLTLISFNAWAAEATHGMVLFGTEELMAYHLPMFHKVHAKQVVLQYSLPDELKTKLLSHQSQDFLTFVPARFDLEKFLKKPFPLKGDVYLGHFEKDGQLVMSDVTLENVVVLYAGYISLGEAPGETYQLFGTPTDLYSVHLLKKGIAKDHILKMNITSGDSITKSDIDHGIYLESQNGLFADGSQIDLFLLIKLGMCTRVSCQPDTYKFLKLTIEKTIFSDDVM